MLTDSSGYKIGRTMELSQHHIFDFIFFIATEYSNNVEYFSLITDSHNSIYEHNNDYISHFWDFDQVRAIGSLVTSVFLVGWVTNGFAYVSGASLIALGTGVLVSVATVAVVAIYVIVTIIIKANEEEVQYETQ